MANAALASADENAQVAAQLREAAALLYSQEGNPFRIAAYRKAADSVARAEHPVRELFDAQGRAGLQSLTGVGPGIASAVAEMLRNSASGSARRPPARSTTRCTWTRWRGSRRRRTTAAWRK